jgi:hypothetical protein
MACEYGPIAAGACLVATTSFAMKPPEDLPLIAQKNADGKTGKGNTGKRRFQITAQTPRMSCFFFAPS